jgi:hypothetical protein
MVWVNVKNIIMVWVNVHRNGVNLWVTDVYWRARIWSLLLASVMVVYLVMVRERIRIRVKVPFH